MVTACIFEIAEPSLPLHAERRFCALLESAPDAMVIADATGKIVMANSQAEELFLYTREELLGRPIEMLMPDRFGAAHIHHRAAFFAKPRARAMGSGLELCVRRKDRSEVPVEISLSPIETREGVLVSSAIRDVTERKHSEEVAARLAAIVESASDAIIGMDLNGVIQSWNPAAERMFGHSAAEAIGKNIRVLIRSEHEAEEHGILEAIRRGERVEPYETQWRRKGDLLVDVWLTTSPVRDARGVVIGASNIARDLTERKQLERKLEDEARTDVLTGTATRRYFWELAQREFARVRRHGGEMSVLALDVDRLKEINDRYGHAVGDRALETLARECLDTLREEDVIGRLGGDEFAVLLPETGIVRAAKVSERLRIAIAGVELSVGFESRLHCTASIGVATLATTDATFDSVLQRADKAMYAAKHAGRDTVSVAGPAGSDPTGSPHAP